MGSQFLARLPMGADLLEAITDEFRSRSIGNGSFTLIGAATKAVIGFYDPVNRQYHFKEFDGAYEIVACMGNISEKDGEIFAHAHILISDENLQCIGGHLGPGTRIFASELYGTVAPGHIMKREYDDATGLMLWARS
ncbi:MAG: DUF296 domain-containing protein [Deltaproteobacteria bacterium]|nr:DUF296 domain-containing protein [Deltaproteobacteria bacterium]